MKTAAEYVESLRQRNLRLFVDGQWVDEPVDHPKVRPAINAIAETYEAAHNPETRSLATTHSELIDGPVNRFCGLFNSPQDLLDKLELQRYLGRRTGTCFQRCVGLDGINAVFIATWTGDDGDAPRARSIGHKRFVRWLTEVQRHDLTLNGAMTDPKGDRSKRPAAQPDHYLRIVERRDDGLVIHGAKVHQTGAANAHQILVMPGQALRAGEEDFAVACALPVDAPGVSMVLGRQPSDNRRGTADIGNAKYGGQECVVIFDRVFVPYDRVFIDGDLAACALLLDAFSGFHRASYGGCKPGNLDVLVGASDLLAQEHGVRGASHVRDKLVEMSHLTETIYGLGRAACGKCAQSPSGVWQVDKVLANVCKRHVTQIPYEVVRLAEDLAGGSLTTLPPLETFDHPDLRAALEPVALTPTRAKTLRLVESMAYGANSVPFRIECMHGAGSPQAQRIVLERSIDWEAKVASARRLAGLDEDR